MVYSLAHNEKMPLQQALPLAISPVVTTTASSTISTSASTLTSPAATATTTTATEPGVSLSDYQTLASSHASIAQMVQYHQNRLGSVEYALAEIQPVMDFLQRIQEEQPFGKEGSPETIALNQTYYHLCVYLTNLFIGASAVASTVVERAAYTTGDKIKELLKSFAKAAGPLGTLMELAYKGTEHVIKEAGEAIELGEFVAELVPEDLKESVAEHFFTSQEEKLRRFSEKRKTMLEQDGIVTYTAKRLVEVYRDPIVNARLSEKGIQTLAGQMVLRIFFNIRHGVIGNHADDMVADVLLYRPNQGEKWLGRFFNKKLKREDKKASRLTDIELLSYTNLCWQTEAGEVFLCKLNNVNNKVNALGYRDMPEEFAAEIRQEKIPSTWQAPQLQLTATVTVTTSTADTDAHIEIVPSADGTPPPDTQALLRRMARELAELKQENQALRESQQAIQENQQSQAELLQNVRGTLFQGDAAAEELGLRRDTQESSDGTLLVTGQDFADGNARALRVKVQSERNEQRINAQAETIAELVEQVETVAVDTNSQRGSKKGCVLM